MATASRPRPTPEVQDFKPFVPPTQEPAELTVRAVALGAILGIVFAASSVYLALKIGLTVATSIPAAVISMAVLRSFRDSTIQENNIVQTIASAAGTLSAIVFVLPGLIMVGWWTGFPYWLSVAVIAIGGILGVMYSVPLRRALVTGTDLPFPEGVAAAEVLKVGTGAGGVWATSNNGTVAEIDPGTNQLVSTIRIGEGGRTTLAVGGGSVWASEIVASGESAPVVRVDPETAQVAETVLDSVGSPLGMAFGAGALWIANYDDGTVTRVTAKGGTATANSCPSVNADPTTPGGGGGGGGSSSGGGTGGVAAGGNAPTAGQTSAAGQTSSAGSGGAPSSAGGPSGNAGSTSSTAGSGSTSAGAAGAANSGDSGGCGCQVVGASTASAAGLGALVAALAVSLRRRRGRESR